MAANHLFANFQGASVVAPTPLIPKKIESSYEPARKHVIVVHGDSVAKADRWRITTPEMQKTGDV